MEEYKQAVEKRYAGRQQKVAAEPVVYRNLQVVVVRGGGSGGEKVVIKCSEGAAPQVVGCTGKPKCMVCRRAVQQVGNRNL